MPVQCFGYRVGRCSGEHGYCEKTEPDDPDCEDDLGEASGERFERFSGLLGRLDVD